MDTPEIKLLFAGPTGVGKTTAIAAISERAPVSTDVAATDELQKTKSTTTVALDYGRIELEDGTILGLYGCPGQERFGFMWEILSRGIFGLVLLIDGSSESALNDLRVYCGGFARVIAETGVVVGVNKVSDTFDPTPYADLLQELNILAPILPVDLRKKSDVKLLLNTLLATIEFA